ncbi:MAG: hypothetical protein WA608_08315 [Candidatus Acidiferrales bacterium]
MLAAADGVVAGYVFALTCDGVRRRPDRTDRRDLAEQLRRWVLLTFGEQLAPYFLAQRS